MMSTQAKHKTLESVIETYNGEYKRVPLNPEYIAFDDGRVWSCRRNKFLSTSKHRDGYLFLNTRLKVDEFGKKKQLLVHQVIAMTFLPNPLLLTEVNHKNAVKTDNRTCNLEWSNRKHNMNHAAMAGCFKNTTKLSIDQVTSIKKLRKEYKISIRKLAALFNVNRGSIEGILYNRSFKYIK